MIKKIIYCLFIFLAFAIFARSTTAIAPTINPQQGFLNSVPFSMSGVNCGLPNSSADVCCGNSASFNVSNEDLNNLIVDLTDGNHKNLDKSLTSAQKDTLENLMLINAEDLNSFALLAGLLNKIDSGSQLSDAEKILLTNTLTQSAQKLNSLKGGDLLKLQIRKTYADKQDTCIIDAKVVHGFCIRGMSEFFAGVVGDNPNFQAILNFAKNSPPEQCVLGTAVGQGSSCRCVSNVGAEVLCNDYLIGAKEYNSCIDCYSHKRGIWTGLGCIQLTAVGFVGGTLLGWGVGLAGIIALLCIMYSAFILQTSQGNPEKIKKAKEYLTSCIIGLLIIIFSIFILRLIGVNILQIPGFGS